MAQYIMDSYKNTVTDIYNGAKNRFGEPVVYAVIMAVVIYTISHTVNISRAMAVILIAVATVYFINEYRNKMTNDFNTHLSNIAKRSKNYRQILAKKVQQLEQKCVSEIETLKKNCHHKNNSQLQFQIQDSPRTVQAYNPSSIEESEFHIGDDPTDY